MSRLPGTPMQASLYELALESADPQRLTRFYTDALGYQFRQDELGLLGIGPERRLRILAGKPKRLGYAAYAVLDPQDLQALRVRLERAQVPVGSRPSRAGPQSVPVRVGSGGQLGGNLR